MTAPVSVSVCEGQHGAVHIIVTDRLGEFVLSDPWTTMWNVWDRKV